jgi:hypothetical protein
LSNTSTSSIWCKATLPVNDPVAHVSDIAKLNGFGQTIAVLGGSEVLMQFAVSSSHATSANAYLPIESPPPAVFLCRHEDGCRFVDVQLE